MTSLLDDLKKSQPRTDGLVFDNLKVEYQKIIMRSLVTTFGLNFLIKDRLGGDVDTIHNVRNVPNDYKNPKNADNYNKNVKYNGKEYRSNHLYIEMVSKVRKVQVHEDAYISDSTVYYGKASYLETNLDKKGSIDHIVSAKEVHEDPGRILAGLDGKLLANSEENLAVTNARLNSSKGATPIPEYINSRGEELSEASKIKMRNLDIHARKSIDNKINAEYYSSEQFYNDAINAAHNIGAKISATEAVGFMMIEIFYACKNRLDLVVQGSKFTDYFDAISKGVSDGVTNIQNNLNIVLKVLGEAYISGLISSISTTFINAFMTTNIAFIKNIRTTSATLVKATSVLLFNPGNLLLGDRYKATCIILTSGVSTVLGTSFSKHIKAMSSAFPSILSDKLSVFVELMISGMISYTTLYMIDSSSFLGKIIGHFNQYAPIGYDINYYCKEFERIAAYLNNYDIEEFSEECNKYNDIIEILSSCDSESSFEFQIDKTMKELEIDMDELEDFLNGKSSEYSLK